jgi:hypothetical protein
MSIGIAVFMILARRGPSKNNQGSLEDLDYLIRFEDKDVLEAS